MDFGPNAPQIINAITAVASGLIGALAGGTATFLVQRGLAQKARRDQRSAVAAMFVADIRAMKHWMNKTNLFAAMDMVGEFLKDEGQTDPNWPRIRALFKANGLELDETIHRKQALLAGSLGLLAVDVATFYATIISLKGNLLALADGLYDDFQSMRSWESRKRSRMRLPPSTTPIRC